MGKLIVIEHPRLLCPNCGDKNIRILVTKHIRIKEAPENIIMTHRFYHCRQCKKNFRTIERYYKHKEE